MVELTTGRARESDNTFFVWLAAFCVLVAFAGFAPSYWLQLPAGTFIGSPLLHLHGALFSAWPVLLLSQAWLASTGRLRNHRAWGLAGISLATALVFVGVTTAIGSLNHGLAQGYGDRSRAFVILPLSAIIMFAGFFLCAIANIKNSDAHKRYMMLATIALLGAAMARVFFFFIMGTGPGVRPGLGPPPPLAIGLVPSLLLELMIVAGMIYDWRRSGRPHRVWWIGLVVMTLVIVLRGPISGTTAWLNFAEALAHIAG